MTTTKKARPQVEARIVHSGKPGDVVPVTIGGSNRRIEYLELGAIKGAKRNPKDHDVGAIQSSFAAFGVVETPALDERTGRLVAGHGRIDTLRALKREGREAPDGIVVEGDRWLVPVMRGWSSKNDTEAEAYLVASNRTVELGGWDNEQLRASLESIAKDSEEALLATGYDADDLDKMIAAAGRELNAGDPNEVVEIPANEEPWVKRGEVYQLDKHLILCGDSLKAEEREAVLPANQHNLVDAVVTDPPYAIYGSSTGIGSDIADDKMVRPFFEATMRVVHSLLKPFGHAYLFTDWRSWAAMWDGGKSAGMSPKNAIVWDKGGGGLGSNWANAYELIGFFAKLPPARAMQSQERSGQRPVHKPNILRFNRVTGEEREHNAAKPVELLAELLDAATEEGGTVVDLFAGSGSTLIAAEKTGRRCVGVEIEPKIAQVAINRWERFTGKKAVKR